MSRVFLEYKDHFDAAHFLRGYEGDCANLHGHRWEVEVCVSGRSLGELGILIDFKELKRIMKKVLPDHRLLNGIPAFEQVNPTAENLALYLFEKIRFMLPYGVRLDSVRVWESPGACARVERQAENG